MNTDQTQQTPTTSKGLGKNIVLIITTIVSLMFFAYGFAQKQEADRQRKLSESLMEEVQKQKLIAAQNELAAQAARMEADKQRTLAMEALAACEKSKKK